MTAAAKYRARPVEVEAMLVTIANMKEVADWCGGTTQSTAVLCVQVPTGNGNAYAYIGHYVVRGPFDFYPCDPDTFAQRWEATS